MQKCKYVVSGLIVIIMTFCDILLHTAVKLLCCIVTHFLLSVVNRCCLTDDCKISSRTDWDGMADNIIAQNFCIFFLQPQTVIFLILLPVFQFDNKINGLLLFDTFYTEQCLYINDPDTPQFNKVTGDVR